MLKNITTIIDKYEYISFDMFDTLILRTTMVPSDVFLIVEKIYNKKYNQSITGFTNIRVAAESNLYIKNHIPPTIGEIYANIDSFPDKIKNTLQTIEIESELNCIYTNPLLYKVYQYCVKKGKKIIIISDMYLGKEILERMLKKSGYNQYNKIYVSSDLKCDKLTGDIYKLVSAELGCGTYTKILHIGDNFYKDFKMSKKNNFTSLWYFNLRKNVLIIKRFLVGKVLSDENIYRLFYDTNEERCNRYYAFGYKHLGSLIYGYVQWIGQALEQSGTHSVFFMAREGLFIKKAFDLYWGDKFKSKYICVSRKSLKCALEKKTTSQKILLEKYLKQNSMTGKFGLVDIGWIGTMQMSIFYILKSSHTSFDMTGYFLGQKTEYKQYKNILKNKAFLFSYNDNTKTKNSILRALNLLEIIFTADHGTTIGYEERPDGLVVPKFAEYEKDQQTQIIQLIQKGALDYIKTTIAKKSTESCPYGDSTSNTHNSLLSPKKKDIEWLGDLYMVIDGEKRYLAKKQSILHPALFINEYKKSLWRDAYILRNVTVLSPLFTWFHRIRVSRQFKKEITKKLESKK